MSIIALNSTTGFTFPKEISVRQNICRSFRSFSLQRLEDFFGIESVQNIRKTRRQQQIKPRHLENGGE
jgi:hypothetical protein